MMPQANTVALSIIRIKLNGSNMSKDMFNQLDWVEVDDSLYLPAMCTFRLFDPSFTFVDSDDLQIGTAVEVAVDTTSEDGPQSGVIFKGEITAIEPEFSSDSFSSVVVRCYDKSHRLMRVRSTRTFTNKSDADIVKQIASELGLNVEVNAGSTVYDFVMQDNISDYEFLQQRAQLAGCLMKMDGSKLKFSKRSSLNKEAAALHLGLQLIEFSPRLTSASQPEKVQVKGWDYQKKQAITGEASSSDLVGKVGPKNGQSLAKSAFGATGPWPVAGLPVAGQSHANDVAKAMLDEALVGDVQATGIAWGDPRLLSGTFVEVKDIGTRFGGKYLITRARHRYEPQHGTGYRTYLETSNGTGETTADLVTRTAVPAGNVPQTQRVGIAIGIVTNNQDDKDLGRVKVTFPWMPGSGGSDVESYWCRVAMPMTGKSMGFMFLPSVGDEVAVAFEGGHPDYPIVIGSLWNGVDKPPLSTSASTDGGHTYQRIIKTAAGHQIILNDADKEPSIKFIDKSGSNKVLIETKGDSSSGLITVEAESKVLVKAKTVSIDGAQMVDVKSDQNIQVKGNQVKVEAQATMELKAGATMKIDGGGMLELKGGMIKIN